MSKKFLISTVFLLVSPFVLNTHPFLEGAKIADGTVVGDNCGCPCSNFVGPTGPQGPIGFRGITGIQGEIGPEGNVGPIGATGPTGPQGPVGPQGDPGLNGQPGSIGPRGPTGPTGDIGVIGGQGPAGSTGPTGASGPIGPPGPTGLPGFSGGAGSVLGFARAAQLFFPPGQPVGPGEIVTLGSFDSDSTPGFVPMNGGIQVPVKGAYLINYQVMETAGLAANIGLYGDNKNGFFDGTIFFNIVDAVPITGQVILEIPALEVITIRNANIVASFTTKVTDEPAQNTPINAAQMTIWLLKILP